MEVKLCRCVSWKQPLSFAHGLWVWLGRRCPEAVDGEDEDAGAVFLVFGCAGSEHGDDGDDGALFVEDDIRPLDAQKLLLAAIGEADGDLVGEEWVF